ncbi:MAG: hypothetical protein R3B89_27395 [Polyangiaceae bacterium]
MIYAVPTFNGGDGLVMLDGRRAVLVANQTEHVRANAAYLLESDDGWKTAAVRESFPLGSIYATNPVVAGSNLFVLHSRLDELLSHSTQDTSTRKAFIWDIGSTAALVSSRW